ncbi:hypothetical protein EHQ30_00685 [Leptospira brenneri]|uniref:Uncharacterized protein n=2 Tax=Leptospira brenneri TaxID=2023182 RepID=A0A2M9Y1C1_9LEPT|nr:hypothetical protein CH361_12355 [Leptospira brenneri]TGK97109.1 hypothetical protein EHQ30_00685 [Leptospira brenneri]
MEPSISNIYLRIYKKNNLDVIPLLGPKSNAKTQTGNMSFFSQGKNDEIDYAVFLELHPHLPTWRYKVQITNKTKEPFEFDLVYVQDIGICDYSASRLNEYFVCHYIHHEPIHTKDYGYGILSRQNESVSGNHPACFLFSTETIQSYATDGIDLIPDAIEKPLIGKRRQGEHSILGLERIKTHLNPEEAKETSFYGHFFPNLDQLKSFPNVENLVSQVTKDWSPSPNFESKNLELTQSLFTIAKQIEGENPKDPLLRTYFPNEWREIETNESGEILSFFTDKFTHVVLKEKEELCLRPHGQILRTGYPTIPDESSLTTTCYFKGIFLSQLTEGHTSINQYISRNHSYLDYFQSYGFRIFIEKDSEFLLLNSPSLISMKPNSVEWIYFLGIEDLRIQIKTTEDHKIKFELTTTSQKSQNFLLSFHIALDGDNGSLEKPPVITTNENKIQIKPNPESSIYQRLNGKGFTIQSDGLKSWQVSDDRLLFLDGKSKNQPYLTALVSVDSSLQFSIQGDLGSSPNEMVRAKKEIFSHTSRLPQNKIKNKESSSLEQISEILPWFEQNAEIHYLNPRGLEQYSGGGWGTRDVCQGAFEYLLALGKVEYCRNLLLRVFAEQNEDGDWPQWFMLFPRDKEIRASDSHGDILYWPILALSTYLERTSDLDFLKEKTSGIHRKEPRSIREAIEQTVSLINKRLVENTNLPIYGNGDWNDSLQPVRTEFRTHSVSTWTAELQSLTYRALITIYHKIGDLEKVKLYTKELETLNQNIKELCMSGGILTGLKFFGGGDSESFYLHPEDRKSGIHYSILPMIYGILSEVLDSNEVETHLSIIKKYLMGPDGVRLFDSPISYSDGESLEFKRAETASYFGREIGLMYTHAHLRFCEALAYMGKSEEFFHYLNLINPIGIQKKVPASKIRQSNCYYSSSDGSFLDRYEAGKKYKDLLSGNIPLEGGWRVYSSGPGIYIKLVYECLFGIRIFEDGLELDPVLPKGLDGLQWNVQIFDQNLTIIYQVKSENAQIESVKLNETSISFQRKENRYRKGGVKIEFKDLRELLKEKKNELVLELR